MRWARISAKQVGVFARLLSCVFVLCSATVLLSGCGDGTSHDIITNLDKVDMSAWHYNAEHDVYYQTGISYCEHPADATYETLGLFVPGAYFSGTQNEDGETYTVSINAGGNVGGFTPSTAPMVVPVGTPGYMAMDAPTNYDASTSAFTDAGYVYVWAGCRGRDAGAPAAITDLKSAIRYVRYTKDVLPGSVDRIYSFGMSGGGAQSALLGASGDSDLFTPYLNEIGACQNVSDAVQGAMCWCPITNLDYANEAYEWNLGATRTGLSASEQTLSNEMAERYAQYINELGLKDENGNVLTLEASDEGIYQAGSYYDYVKSVVEQSLNNFLTDTTFPYDASSASQKGGRGGFAVGEGLPDGMTLPPLDGAQKPQLGAGRLGATERDNIERTETTSSLKLTGTYATAQAYIDALNANGDWVTYDPDTNTATITSVDDFVKALKPATKSVGAFDSLDRSQGENELFGTGTGDGLHFDAAFADIIKNDPNYADTYGSEFDSDFETRDAQGKTVQERVDMYNPLYYLSPHYAGYKTSKVATNWRIRTGINQGDTALSTEINLALALENYGGLSVDFTTVWGLEHVEAERSGVQNADANFIAWVDDKS